MSAPYGSVSQDWRKPLSDETSRAYANLMRTLETAYTIFSINLDEAFGFQRCGRVALAYEVLRVAPALCQRLAAPMHSLLCAMLEHAKHFGTTPNLLPLNPDNFQQSRSQRVARFNDLLGRVLLTRKSQFVYKISALADLVDELDLSYEGTIEGLCEEESLYPERDWVLLGSVHFDLTTCLRETEVLFKSFLHALPQEQIEEFEANVRTRSGSCEARWAEQRHLAHRRMAFLKGQ